MFLVSMYLPTVGFLYFALAARSSRAEPASFFSSFPLKNVIFRILNVTFCQMYNLYELSYQVVRSITFREKQDSRFEILKYFLRKYFPKM